eukprot:2760454-Amphidinium_carterae.1
MVGYTDNMNPDNNPCVTGYCGLSVVQLAQGANLTTVFNNTLFEASKQRAECYAVLDSLQSHMATLPGFLAVGVLVSGQITKAFSMSMKAFSATIGLMCANDASVVLGTGVADFRPRMTGIVAANGPGDLSDLRSSWSCHRKLPHGCVRHHGPQQLPR